MTICGGAAGGFLRRGEGAAADEVYAEHIEIIGGDDGGESAPGVGAVADANHGEVVGEDAGELAAGLLAEIAVGRVGKRAVFLGVLPVLRVELDDLFRVGKRARAEDQRVDDAENTGVNADAEGQHDDGRCGEAGRLGEQAEGEFQVLKEGVHGDGQLGCPEYTPAGVKDAEIFRLEAGLSVPRVAMGEWHHASRD